MNRDEEPGEIWKWTEKTRREIEMDAAKGGVEEERGKRGGRWRKVGWEERRERGSEAESKERTCSWRKTCRRESTSSRKNSFHTSATGSPVFSLSKIARACEVRSASCNRTVERIRTQSASGWARAGDFEGSETASVCVRLIPSFERFLGVSTHLAPAPCVDMLLEQRHRPGHLVLVLHRQERPDDQDPEGSKKMTVRTRGTIFFAQCIGQAA